jgi:hypothetical protein
MLLFYVSSAHMFAVPSPVSKNINPLRTNLKMTSSIMIVFDTSYMFILSVL